MGQEGVPAGAPLIPARLALPRLRLAASRCTACDLYKTGTQTVFGEGLETALAIFVGEQPGDIEDRVGRPFVGPAGKLLDRALEEAGVDRKLGYVPHVGKDFKWTPRRQPPPHEKPNAREIPPCPPGAQGGPG